MSTSRYYSNSDMTWMHLLLININMLFLARSKCMYCFVLWFVQVHDYAGVLARCSFTKTHVQTAGGGSRQGSFHDLHWRKSSCASNKTPSPLLSRTCQFWFVCLCGFDQSGVSGPVGVIRAVLPNLPRLQQHLFLRRRLCVCSRPLTWRALPS